MSTSPSDLREALAQSVTVTEDALIVDLVDGRTVSVPLPWYPRLAHGTPTERANWRLIGRGEGVHWPDLDEDVTVASFSPAGLPARHRTPSDDGWSPAQLLASKPLERPGMTASPPFERASAGR